MTFGLLVGQKCNLMVTRNDILILPIKFAE